MNWDKRLFDLKWSQDIINYDEKLKVAKEIASFVKDGDVVGVGSGSTSFLAIQEIAKRLKNEGLKILAIPTSNELKMTCSLLGIETASISEVRPDWCFDGADEVDPHGWLVKGRGGAMFNEKLIMVNSAKRYIIVDGSKFVEHICDKFPVPVECVPAALTSVKNSLSAMNVTEMNLRLAGKAKDGPIITENGNYILDVKFADVNRNTEKDIKSIVGVVESGLFIEYNVEIIRS